jgi:hypothetical protein
MRMKKIILSLVINTHIFAGIHAMVPPADSAISLFRRAVIETTDYQQIYNTHQALMAFVDRCEPSDQRFKAEYWRLVFQSTLEEYKVTDPNLLRWLKEIVRHSQQSDHIWWRAWLCLKESRRLTSAKL